VLNWSPRNFIALYTNVCRLSQSSLVHTITNNTNNLSTANFNIAFHRGPNLQAKDAQKWKNIKVSNNTLRNTQFTRFPPAIVGDNIPSV
jgi:hypothetical protein